MKSLRPLTAACLTSIALAVTSAAFPALADASPRHYTSYGACLTAGNKLAQQAKVHNFACVAEPNKGPHPHTIWDLVIYS
ncbi:hypothetical protein [Amycolatopsis sp. PS_44_ISF1]|uniref:hypothetical protein n=1 Tax=Amycolatopsis sp. PS_44_ISF1 TaxID=2974917 RepID=UPI0028DDAE5E|nr:hypothetical protein [Amycolatopsis sp. PS_44_ISF1]MDT8911659.1 hypothetical protein [Amycolatopsis sp. PS_44_ISF1]